MLGVVFTGNYFIDNRRLVASERYPHVKRLGIALGDRGVILKERTHKRLKIERQRLEEIRLCVSVFIVNRPYLEIVHFKRLVTIISHPRGKRVDLIADTRASGRNHHRDILGVLDRHIQNDRHRLKRRRLGTARTGQLLNALFFGIKLINSRFEERDKLGDLLLNIIIVIFIGVGRRDHYDTSVIVVHLVNDVVQTLHNLADVAGDRLERYGIGTGVKFNVNRLARFGRRLYGLPLGAVLDLNVVKLLAGNHAVYINTSV